MLGMEYLIIFAVVFLAFLAYAPQEALQVMLVLLWALMPLSMIYAIGSAVIKALS